MDDTTIEKKLQLVQQIRSQYNRNQYDMSNRERILYGRGDVKQLITDANNNEEILVSESFKIRSVLAALLFIMVVVFDMFEITPAGIEMKQVFNIIAADYQENMTAFMDAMTEESILEPQMNGTN